MATRCTTVQDDLAECRLCSDRFAATRTQHRPRPIVWFRPGARILIVSQAPGLRAHKIGRPFYDPSGVRLRDWTGLDEATFYDQDKVAIVPMAFCFPGYDRNGGDLPPPPICARTWRDKAMASVPGVKVTLVVGGYAQKWHLGTRAKDGVTTTVAQWREHAPEIYPLPHPSWRNNAWLKRNPWFETDLLPSLRSRISKILNDD